MGKTRLPPQPNEETHGRGAHATKNAGTVLRGMGASPMRSPKKPQHLPILRQFLRLRQRTPHRWFALESCEFSVSNISINLFYQEVYRVRSAAARPARSGS